MNPLGQAGSARARVKARLILIDRGHETKLGVHPPALPTPHTGESFAKWVKGLRPKLAVEVIKRSDTADGFKVLARRWVVERTFGWLMHQRRLVRDYETTESREALI